jgi:ATP-binding cassette subfamily B protein
VHVEERIHDALGRLLSDRTTLVIAHRLSTIALADRVLLLEGGRIVADGSHADLMATEPRYAEVLAHIEGAEGGADGGGVVAVAAAGGPAPRRRQRREQRADGVGRRAASAAAGLPRRGGPASGLPVRRDPARAADPGRRAARHGAGAPPVEDVAFSHVDATGAPSRSGASSARTASRSPVRSASSWSRRSPCRPGRCSPRSASTGASARAAAPRSSWWRDLPLAVVLNAAASALRIAWTGRVGESLMFDLRVRIFSHLQRLSVPFFTEEKAGRLMTRMTSDLESLTQLFQDGLVQMVVQGLTIVVVTVILFTMDVQLAAVTLLAVVPGWWR